MKKKDLIIIIIFIMFLTLPSVLYWFLKDKMDLTNYENRNLYVKPELNFKNITQFPRNYENYFNDHLAFKNEIRKTRSNILYNVFNISSSPRVIVGEDGWLFYNSRALEDGDSISDYRNFSRYSDDDKEEIKDSLLKTRDTLKKQNIDFYILVAPNKENVYSDKLEEIIKRSKNKESKTEDLINYLEKNTDLNITYPKEQLIKNRKINDTYYKYDTHWNYYGAYLGVTELMKVINSNFSSPKVSLSSFMSGGDLTKMNLTPKMENKEPSVNGFYDNIKYECEDSVYKICTSNNSIYDKTILFVGDSFRTATIQYLAKLYKKSIFIHRNSYEEDLIKKYNPDIVIYEAVERYSRTLKNTHILTANS